MFSQYAAYFQAILGLYCVSSLVFLAFPLYAVTYFIFFRSTLSVAAYTQAPGILGLPFFIPSLIILLFQCVVSSFKSNISIKFNGVMKIYLAFTILCTALCCLFIVMGKSIYLNIEEISKLYFPILAYILVYVGIQKKEDLLKTNNLFILISILPVLLGIGQFIIGYSYSYLQDALIAGRRPTATIIDPNLYGIYLALTLFLFLPKVLNQSTVSKTTFFYLILLLAAIIFAQNRGTWISLFIGIMTTAFFFRDYINLKKWMVFLFLAALAAAPIILSRFAELHEYDQWGQEQNTAEGRLEYSVALFIKALHTPLTGDGAGSFDIGLRNGGGQVVPPHNDYIRIACQYGFPAMLLYFSFFMAQFRYAIRNKLGDLWPYQFASAACIMYLVIISLAQNVYSDTVSYMMFMAVLALSHRATALSKTENTDTETQTSDDLYYKAAPKLKKSSKWIAKIKE